MSDAILDAAEAAFAADGIESAGMQAIAARAGTSVGTLYNYFEDRDALVRALLEDRKRRLTEELDRAAVGQGFHAQLRGLVQALLSYFDAHRTFFRVLVTHERATVSKRRTSMQLLRDRMRSVIDAGVKEGVLAQERAQLATAMLSGVLRSLLLDDEEERFVDLVDDVVDIFIHGAGVRASRDQQHE
ncbi:MAG TPA: TetR/AcrR family transcriptional regulator [Myxococcota bacterium]